MLQRSRLKPLEGLIACLLAVVFAYSPVYADEPPIRGRSQICGENSLIPIMQAPETWRNLRKPIAKIKVQGIGVGTGFLYDNCCLVTAKHVIDSAGPSDIQIWFGYEDTSLPYEAGYQCPKDIWYCCSLKVDDPNNYDVGVLYVKKRNGKCPGNSGYGILQISSVGPKQGDGVHLIGHPRGRCKEYSHDSYATIKSNGTDPACGSNAGLWSHGADTDSGSSGSPVFDDAAKLIGIHTGADGADPCKNCFVPTASVYNWLTGLKPCPCDPGDTTATPTTTQSGTVILIALFCAAIIFTLKMTRAIGI